MKRNSISTLVAVLAIFAMSCNLLSQAGSSAGTQTPESPTVVPTEGPSSGQPATQSASCSRGDLSPIGILRSSDHGHTWTSLGNACIMDLGEVLPVDMTGFVSGGRFVLFFVDLLSLNQPKPQIIYRAASSDGVNFDAPQPAYAQPRTMVDPVVLPLADGSFRLYVPSDGEGTISALSRDGLTFTREAGTRTTDGGMPGALQLPDKRVRLFLNGGFEGQNGIYSKISSDGLSFTAEKGMRITSDGPMVTDNAQPIRLQDGSYLMLYMIHDGRKEAPGKLPWEYTEIHLATSADGFDWTPGQDVVGYAGTSCIMEAGDGTLYIYYGGPPN